MMQLRPGSTFAKVYEIVRPISAGGMGIVYEVIHTGTRRHRALKVMLAHIVSDPKMRERFSLEAIVTADIESEHITEVFDAGIDAETDCPYLVMEMLRGEDLGERLKKGQRFDADETLTLMGQVARTLEKTHAKGVVHRDLKPDNLFVTKRDDGSLRVKILDFGIAKIVKANMSGPQATTKTFGTPYYMAREQVTGESALIGPSSDNYAIAQIVFSMLTGAPYFEDEAKANDGNILAVLIAVGKGVKEPATKRALRRGVELPPGFDVWFAKAAATSPKARFPSAIAMIDALREVLREPIRILEGSFPTADPVRASSERIENSLDEDDFADSAGEAGVLPSDAAGKKPFASALGETGGPQSITTQVPDLGRRKPSRVAMYVAGFAVAGVCIGVAGWRLGTHANEGGPTVAAASRTPDDAARDVATKPSAEPTPAPAGASAAQPPTVSAAPADASASASASAAAPPAKLPSVGGRPRPAGTAKAGGEVWEVR